MDFMKIFYGAALLLLTVWIARRDLVRLRIPREGLCLLAALSFPGVTVIPRIWLIRLMMALLLGGILTGLVLLFSRRRTGFLVGGGDIKLLFVLLLHMDWEQIPLYGGIAGFYILMTRLLWVDKRRLPLAPALGGGMLCIVLYEL